MKTSANGALDSIGHTLLDTIDYRVSMLVGALVVIVAVFISWRMNGKWPSKIEIIEAALGGTE
ncbi:MAG: hypothetical protein WAM82_09500 [Thermoanaerobaculia bacterium]